MKNSDKETYWAALNAEAARLLVGQRLPVDISGICWALRIRISYGKLPGKAKAAVLATGKHTEIRLLPDNEVEPVGRSRQRFLIAHELGHIILQRQCLAVPMGTSEYWQHEELCDRFAAELLVPSILLEHLIGKKPATGIDTLTAVNRVAAKAIVPWQTAAIRMSQAYPDIALFTAKVIPDDGPKEKRLRIVASSLPKKKEIGRIIPGKTKLGRELFALTGHRDTKPLDSSFFKEPVIPTCKGAHIGAVSSSGRGKFRIFVSLPSLVTGKYQRLCENTSK